VSLDHLWAGWRASYVSSFDDRRAAVGPASSAGAAPVSNAEDACIFCAIMRSSEPDDARYVLWTGRFAAAVLNIYPYNPGHVMVLPIRHVSDLEGLDPDEVAELWRGVHDAVAAVKAAYRPEGMNLGLNLGRAAGAGIPAHLHVHVVPRWLGDTNFMTTVAGARVLPETLSDTWAKLRAAWA